VKIAIGNLGGLTYALKASLEDLGFDVILPPSNNRLMIGLCQGNLASDLCYPLKVALGNFISVKDYNPDALIFYSGCDLCNLPSANHLYKEILNDQGWYPDIYFCAIDSKQNFIHSYFKLIRKLSKAPLHKLFLSMYLCGIKYEIFHFIDQVFYIIRPTFDDKAECENLYQYYLNKIIQAQSIFEIEKLNIELWELYKNYVSTSTSQFPTIGLIGDSYSLMEPFSHNYVDKYLGNLNISVDKWSYNYLMPQQLEENSNISDKLNCIFRHEIGVRAPIEIKKIFKYIQNDYDGLIFISPFNCNPCDMLRNLLIKVKLEFKIPVLDLLIKEHSSNVGENTRIEAFVDALNRKKRSKNYNNVYPITFKKFSLIKFIHDPIY